MSDLQSFFLDHISKIKRENLVCRECGCELIGDFSEVCHILPKGKFKSVSMNDLNVIYLCGWKSKNNCHAKLDNSSIKTVRSMNCHSVCSDRFCQIENEVKENLTYKDYDKWGKEDG